MLIPVITTGAVFVIFFALTFAVQRGAATHTAKIVTSALMVLGLIIYIVTLYDNYGPQIFVRALLFPAFLTFIAVATAIYSLNLKRDEHQFQYHPDTPPTPVPSQDDAEG